jgi:hypothetical protein
VADGDSLTPTDRARLDRAVRNAERVSGLTFSVYLGVAEEDSRAYAERLHGALPDPPRSVLVMCDPTFRALEVVTGELARRQLDDVACGLAIASMKTSFEGGEIVGGLAYGVQQLGEAAMQPLTLHGGS